MVEITDGVTAIARIRPLIDSYAFGEFRYYNNISEKVQREYLTEKVAIILKDRKSRIFIVETRNGIEAFSILRYLSWDSDIFKRDMWEISLLVSKPHDNLDVDIKIKLLKAIAGYVKKGDRPHLSCRVDASDQSSISALESAGFRLMDTLLTFVFESEAKVPYLKNMFKTRNCRTSDLPYLKDIAKAGFRTNRFHLDAGIDREKADIMYARWVENYYKIAKEGKAAVIVAEGKGGIAGFLCYKLNGLLEKTSGQKVIGRGLLAVRPESKGAAISLINRTLRDTASKYDHAEFDAILTNREVIRIYEHFGFKIKRSALTFHH